MIPSERHLVSVIMPVRDAAPYLPEQLAALAAQTYAGRWELVVTDDASIDRSRALIEAAAAAHGWELLIVVGDGSGPGVARNLAVAAAHGDLLCMCDADDVVAPGWLEAFVEASDGAGLLAGALERRSLNRAAERLSRGGGDSNDQVPTFAPSGNMAIRRDVFDELNGFDPRYRQAEDVDLSWRAIDAGHQVTFVPGAVVSYRYRASTRAACGQAARMGYFGEQLHRDHPARRPDGSALISESKAIGWLVLRIPTLLDRRRRLLWLTHAARLLGRMKFRIRAITAG